MDATVIVVHRMYVAYSLSPIKFSIVVYYLYFALFTRHMYRRKSTEHILLHSLHLWYKSIMHLVICAVRDYSNAGSGKMSG